jgi:hypothetical protein
MKRKNKCPICGEDVYHHSAKWCLRHAIDMEEYKDRIKNRSITTRQAEEMIMAREKIGNEKLAAVFELKSFLNVNAQGWN